MTDYVTTGRLLALNIAAADNPDVVGQLIEDHLGAYSREDAALVMANALDVMACHILLPTVERMQTRDEWREGHRTAARKIIAGPSTEGTES